MLDLHTERIERGGKVVICGDFHVEIQNFVMDLLKAPRSSEKFCIMEGKARSLVESHVHEMRSEGVCLAALLILCNKSEIGGILAGERWTGYQKPV
jgi:hypothetical protein